MSFKLLSIACLLLSVAHAAPHGSTSETLPSGQNIYSPGVKYTHNQREQLVRRSGRDDSQYQYFGDGAAAQIQTIKDREQHRKERAEYESKRGGGTSREPPTKYEKGKQPAQS
ncbi:hypothetical protein HI914_00464 [Erysiphe necator]|nr:hypothetical protein HI914_00464 [Erysiphe necator]